MERSLVENALKYYESRGQPGNYTDVLADQLIRCNIMEEVWRARTITLQIEIRQYDMQLGREIFGRVLSGHVHTGAEVAAPTAGIDNSTIAGPVGPLSPGSVDRRAIGSVNAPAPGPALLPDFTDLPTPTTQAPTSNMTADSMAASLQSTSEVCVIRAVILMSHSFAEESTLPHEMKLASLTPCAQLIAASNADSGFDHRSGDPPFPHNHWAPFPVERPS